MKRTIKYLSFIIVLLCCGCSAEYNIEIDDFRIAENLVINSTEKEKEENGYVIDMNNIYSYVDMTNEKKYKVKEEKNGNNLKYSLSQNLTLNSFNGLRTFEECFDSYNLVQDSEIDGAYILSTSEGFKCLGYEYIELDNVKINIKTNNTVISSNADSVNNNTYTWIIDDSNVLNKSIDFRFHVDGYTKKKIEENKKAIKKTKMDAKYVYFILFSILGIIVVIIFVVLYKNKKQNEL